MTPPAPRSFSLKPTILILCLLGVALGLFLAIAGPDPFADLLFDERPSRFFMLLRVGGAFIAFFAALRVLGWKSLAVDGEGVELRGWFSRKRHLWRDLKSKAMDKPEGAPPTYRLRFTTGTVELVASHWRPADIEALRQLTP